MHLIIGNFGNHSLAAMQALIERGVAELHFIYVETGWAAASWEERVQLCSDYARNKGVLVHVLKAKADFAEMVRDRRQFPSQKFQWCAGFLKGLALIDHLDKLDPSCEALIVSGKRRADSRRYADLSEFDYEDEYYQGRTLWHPLWQTKDEDFVALIKRTGLSILPHQSLECSPCIHTKTADLSQLDAQALTRLETLEQNLDQTMFHQPIKSFCTSTKPSESQDYSLKLFDLGCGSPWNCGE